MERKEANRHRYNRARDALNAWARYEALSGAEAEPCQVRDLLADLMHLCDVQGIDFDHETEMARAFFADESEG